MNGPKGALVYHPCKREGREHLVGTEALALEAYCGGAKETAKTVDLTFNGQDR